MMPLMPSLTTTWYVDATRPDDAGDGMSWAKAKNTIQEAINIAESNDTIIVANGVYAPISTENKTITIRSVNGAEASFIDGGNATRCATLGSDETHTNTVLFGFTLTNGLVREAHGGGSYCGTLNNCVLSGNEADDGGGASCGILNNCTLSGNKARWYAGASCFSTLNNCILIGNQAESAGGAYMATLNNCVVAWNTARYFGGGANYSTLNNCVLFGNSANRDGGGVDGESTLNNCTVVGNMASRGGGIYSSQETYLNNCIVIGNFAFSGCNYSESVIFRNSCTTPLPSGDGNMAVYPQFVDVLKLNFRLQAGSPCIDTGDNECVIGNVDTDGNPRIQNGKVDMGAYEWRDERRNRLWLGWMRLW